METQEFELVIIGGGIVGLYSALQAARRGIRVAIVEKGSLILEGKTTALPRVVSSPRCHKGSNAARRHVLGGNSSSWGGGLLRLKSSEVAQCLGISKVEIFNDFQLFYETVEKNFGIRFSPQSFAAANESLKHSSQTQIIILPGARRSLVTNGMLAELRSFRNCSFFTEAELLNFDGYRLPGSDKLHVENITMLSKDGFAVLRGQRFLISAGQLDSILVVDQALEAFGSRSDFAIGEKLHDHFSVPLARIRLRKALFWPQYFCMTFKGPFILASHYELKKRQREWMGDGFVHFTASFENYEPYRTLRGILDLRQKGVGRPRAYGRLMIRLLKQLPTLALIAMFRVFKGRLFVGSNVELTLTLDFESFPSGEKRLDANSDPLKMDWDICPKDEKQFLALFSDVESVCSELQAKFDLDVEWICEGSSDEALVEHLHKFAVDAYHLGGGIGLKNGNTGIDQDLRIKGFDNLHIASSAAFIRPGVANPTHTLLALAQRFISTFFGGTVS